MELKNRQYRLDEIIQDDTYLIEEEHPDNESWQELGFEVKQDKFLAIYYKEIGGKRDER